MTNTCQEWAASVFGLHKWYIRYVFLTATCTAQSYRTKFLRRYSNAVVAELSGAWTLTACTTDRCFEPRLKHGSLSLVYVVFSCAGTSPGSPNVCRKTNHETKNGGQAQHRAVETVMNEWIQILSHNTWNTPYYNLSKNICSINWGGGGMQVSLTVRVQNTATSAHSATSIQTCDKRCFLTY